MRRIIPGSDLPFIIGREGWFARTRYDALGGALGLRRALVLRLASICGHVLSSKRLCVSH
jgi:hypothetical protein